MIITLAGITSEHVRYIDKRVGDPCSVCGRKLVRAASKTRVGYLILCPGAKQDPQTCGITNRVWPDGYMPNRRAPIVGSTHDG